MARVTSKDIARRAGVSRSTVSFVINGRMDLPVAPATRARVLGLAAEMGYVPNAAARGLVTGRSYLIGISTHTPTDPHYVGLLDDSLLLARQAGYHLLIVSSLDINAPGLLADGRLDGLIKVGDPALLSTTTEEHFPVIYIGCPLYSQDEAFRPRYTVQWDDREGGAIAARHLLELGHRRIAILAGNTDRQHPKVRGFREAANAAGLEPAFFRYSGTGGPAESGRIMLDELLALHLDFTAVFCRNDEIALGVLSRAAQLGLRVPRDLSVVGYSDIPMAAFAAPALTSIATPIRQAGKLALELLLKVLGGEVVAPTCVQLPTRLVERDSTSRLTQPKTKVKKPGV